MYLTDFVYDNYKLSDYGCMVGCASTSVEDSFGMGSNIKLETVKNHGNYIDEIVNADYEDPVTLTFDIIKASCPKTSGRKDYFTEKELSFFMRWLNRKQFYKFIPIYDTFDYYKTYFMGTFTEIKAINIGGKVIGLTLTFTANAPFGYLSLKENTFEIPSGGVFTLTDFSDEIGSIYPSSFVLTCDNKGDYIINHKVKNETNWTRTTIINNCSAGEIITLDCIHKIITTSDVNHTTLFNDFNYTYPRLTNTVKERDNLFTVNNGCKVRISYNPIRKAGVIV